jgi:hypothetical protein
MIERATLTIPAGQNWCALPAGWLAFSRITLPGNPTQNNGGNVVEWMPPDMLEDLPTPGNANVYSIEGGRLLYGAVQDATGLAQDLNVKYFKHPGNLGSVLAPDTTFLLAQAPSIYLYAALVEAAIYVKKSDKIAEYGLLLDKAIEGFMSVEKAAQYSGSAIRFRRA